MRKAPLQMLFGFIVALLAACGGSPASPTPSPAQAAPLSIYFSASDASLLSTLYALNASDGMVRWSYQTGLVLINPIVG